MDKKNPGPSDEQFNKTKGKMSNAGRTGVSKGKANMQDEQFNKLKGKASNPAKAVHGGETEAGNDEQFNEGQAVDEDMGPSVKSGGVEAGKDKQFTKSEGKQGNPKAKMTDREDDGMNFNVDKKRASAHQIMTEIARAMHKPPQKNQPGSGKIQPEEGQDGESIGGSQSKDYKNSTANKITGRAKSQNRHFVDSEKAPESKPGSKFTKKTKV